MMTFLSNNATIAKLEEQQKSTCIKAKRSLKFDDFIECRELSDEFIV